MALRNYPQAVKEFAIQAYKKPSDKQQLQENHIAFTGTPQKHYYDTEKVILVSDPFSNNVTYYEFWTKDISFVEDLQNVTNSMGQTVPIVRLWIKKESIGVRSTPFVVADTTVLTGG